MQIPDDLYRKKYADRRNIRRRGRISWQAYWRAWLNKRLPPSQQVRLAHNNIFILPSRAGYGFIGFVVILLLVAINFQNSAVYALTFLLAGIFAISILHTFANLMDLKLVASHAEAAFSGRDAVFHLLMVSRSRAHYGVQLSWQNKISDRIDIKKNAEQRVAMRFRTGPRGYCRPGRLKVETSYPLGLITAWTWVDLAMQSVVYPFPDDHAGEPASSSVYHDSGELERQGSDDFFGLRDYVGGDSIRSVAWKNYAKTGVLSSKQFVDYIDQRLWLDWDAAQGSDEQRLQQLCHWALAAEAGANEYGLKLPVTSIPPARGKTHLHKVLTELATYNLPAKTTTNSARASTGNLQSTELAGQAV